MVESSAKRTNELKRHIALVAHDNKKVDLLEWASFNKGTLSKHHLYATGTTGTMLEYELGLKVTRFLSGPVGGDQQIGAKIAEGGIDTLFSSGIRSRRSHTTPTSRPFCASGRCGTSPWRRTWQRPTSSSRHPCLRSLTTAPSLILATGTGRRCASHTEALTPSGPTADGPVV